PGARARRRRSGPPRPPPGRRPTPPAAWSPSAGARPTPAGPAGARSTPAPRRWRSSPNGSARPGSEGGFAVKKFVNDPKSYVPEMLEGVALANPDPLKYVPAYNLIMRADAPSDGKVS